ncbi:MAG: FAD-dependent oxidoreductase [Candidatus Aminicenantes bacterium]|nr:FAD-dependent oxidoreductase [Candidatus Aminicenantes bacterium]
MTPLIILGGGLAGLSAAYHLKEGYTLYEKEDRPGGLCRSDPHRGFLFDRSGHLLHFKNDYARKLVHRLLKGNLITHRRSAWVYSKERYTRYPFQANTYGLPAEVIADCLFGFIEAKKRYQITPRTRYKNFEDWILRNFGRGIAAHFMLPYNEKMWTLPPRELTTEWLSPYVPRPSLEEVVLGALTDQNKPFGYNAEFFYPHRGGIEALVRALAKEAKPITTGCRAETVDWKRRLIRFANGEEAPYNYLISTLPLPEFISMLTPSLPHLERAAAELRFCSVYNINFGISRKNLSDKHWVYFPEKEFSFYRVGFPANFSPHVVSPRASSVYTEVSYSPSRPVDKLTIVDKVKEDLQRAGILKSSKEVIAEKVFDIKYAYVIYDHTYRKNVRLIHQFLQRNQIFSIGRFGGWKYSSMEDAILDGKETAEKIAKLL